jgi:hypothetical protein
MSYTEYLRRKAAGSPVIIDRRTNTDASMHTMRQRHVASSIFFTSNRIGVINNTTDVNTHPSKANRSYVKNTGRVPDASAFTAHSATWQLPLAEGKITVNPCCVPTLGPAPQSASDFTRSSTKCCDAPGSPLFVDTTIRLKHLVGCCDNDITKANHEHPTPTPYASWSPRPEKGAGGIPVYTVASPDDARKVGNFTPRKIPYVEKHHGNDLNVNPRRVPGPFRPNTGIPHLKINDAFPRGCGTCGGSQSVQGGCTCAGSNTYTQSINALPSETDDISFLPYTEETTLCLNDTIVLTYTATEESQDVDFGFTTNVPISLSYSLDGGAPVIVTPTGEGPFIYTVNEIVLTEVDDEIVFTFTVTDCDLNVGEIRYTVI